MLKGATLAPNCGTAIRELFYLCALHYDTLCVNKSGTRHNIASKCYFAISKVLTPSVTAVGEDERVCYLDNHMHQTDSWTLETQSCFFFYSLPKPRCQNGGRHKKTLRQWTNASQASGDLCLTAGAKRSRHHNRGRKRQRRRCGSRLGTSELYREC